MHDPLGEFEFVLFGNTYTVNPRKDLETHISSVGEHLQTQPATFAFYGVLRDHAVNVVDAWESALQQKQAELYLRWQEDGSIKLTELSVKENTRGHAEYIEIQEAIVNARLLANRLNTITKAFEDRRFCLVALASRAGNNTFNDADVRLPVSKEHVSREFVLQKGVGKHPSQKGQ